MKVNIMKVNIVPFFFFVLIFMCGSYSAQNVSCNTYSTQDNYFLNESLFSASLNCLVFSSGASGSTLDCKGYNISG